MTVNEFKAFIEGMDIKTSPTPDQWEKIIIKLEMVNPPSIPIEGVYRPTRKVYDPPPIWPEKYTVT